MDHGAFDRLVRLFATAATRRAALRGLLGSVLLGQGLDALAKKKGKGKRKGTGRAKSKGKGKAKGKGKKKAQGRATAANACYPRTTNCQIGAMKNGADCDWTTTTPPQNLYKFNGARANFRGVQFIGANLSDANLSGACLVDANLIGANLTRTNFANAIRCRTTRPDGQPDNSGCALGTACCPTCIGFGNACENGIGGGCCGGAVCTGGTCACPADKPHRCSDGVCRACCSDAHCAPEQNCQVGVCVADCDVCPTCTYQTVQAAIAAGLTTIRICPGAYPTNVAITRSLTLIGSGSGTNSASNTLLDGGTTGRVLDVNPGSVPGVAVTVRNLRIQRGGGVPDGAGIYNRGALTLENVAVANCAAVAQGGGIETETTLNLTDCDIHDNSAGGIGGGIHGEFPSSGPPVPGSPAVTLLRTRVRNNTVGVRGGGIDMATGVLTLKTGTSIENNTATGQGGGGILLFSDAKLTMEAGSSVSANRAPGTMGSGTGGGILSLGSAVVADLQAGSSVTGNRATDGGGIFEGSGSVTLANNTIVTGNTLMDGTTTNNCRPPGTVPLCVG